jgi:hypothetical protein
MNRHHLADHCRGGNPAIRFAEIVSDQQLSIPDFYHHMKQEVILPSDEHHVSRANFSPLDWRQRDKLAALDPAAHRPADRSHLHLPAGG